MILLNGGGDNARYADAVTAHRQKLVLAGFTQHTAVHSFRIFIT